MNYVIVETVVDGLIRKFRLKEWQYDLEELAESIAKALRLIGAAKMYEEKTVPLVFAEQAARLPTDCIHVKYVYPQGTPYKESGSFITMNVADGAEAFLVYQAMPIDTRGYPLVPDSPEVEEALIWFIVRDLTLQGEVKTVNYQMAEQEWQWRCGSARATLSVLSTQEWAGVAHDYYRLNPRKDVHEKGYTEIGTPNTLKR